MPFEIVRGDITKMKVDAIVNAANSRLAEGGGVCGAIFSAAGARELREECEKIGFCSEGGAVVTDGLLLPAKKIIHTVGPVWQGGRHGEKELLYSCYKSSLEFAREMGLLSIAFPLISSGIFGYPQDKALNVAKIAITDFLRSEDSMSVYLVLFYKEDGKQHKKKSPNEGPFNEGKEKIGN